MNDSEVNVYNIANSFKTIPICITIHPEYNNHLDYIKPHCIQIILQEIINIRKVFGNSLKSLIDEWMEERLNKSNKHK